MAGHEKELYFAHSLDIVWILALFNAIYGVARGAERLRRLQSETRAVAALNHRRIITLFPTEDADAVHPLTMELLDRLIPVRNYLSSKSLGLPMNRAAVRRRQQ
jgi:hypothetical protein